MSEWWTYTLTAFLLFSPRTYYRLFELYNAAVWPMQIVTLALGLTILMMIARVPAWSGRAVAALLASLWLVVAWAYLLERYDTINWAARYFAVGFAVQAALLLGTGVIRDRLRFGGHDLAARIGLFVFVFALVLYPFIPLLTGRPIAQAEIFGLAPDPTAIGTLGLLLAAARPPWHLLVIPLLWCVLTGLTLWTMESPEALLPLFAATLAAVLALRRGFTVSPKTDG